MQNDSLPYLLTPYGRNRDIGRECIASVLKDMGAKNGVEIGVRKGLSAIVWMEKNPEMKLTCIDPWLGRQEKYYKEACDRLKSDNVTIVRSTSMDALPLFKDSSLDFVHIDGNHEFDYVVTDIVFWSKKLKQGGLMAVHDYIEFHRSGVIDAVRGYTRCNNIEWFITRDRLPTVLWLKP